MSQKGMETLRHWYRCYGRAPTRLLMGVGPGYVLRRRRPIFVMGNQKSGTTAVAALLAAHAGKSVTLDLPAEREAPMFYRVHAGQCALWRFVARNWPGFSREIVKEPHLTLLWTEMRRVFPEAQHVFVVRDPRDNIRSILDRLDISGKRENLTEQERRAVPLGWRMVLDGRWLGMTGETFIEQLSQRWCRMARSYLDAPEGVVAIRYEEFLNNKKRAIASVASDLGLPKVSEIDHLMDQQFQPKGNRQVGWEEFFGRANLIRIERICSEEMRALGYKRVVHGDGK